VENSLTGTPRLKPIPSRLLNAIELENVTCPVPWSTLKYGPTEKFVVLGFPCAQFMNQEFSKSEETCPFVRGLLAKFGDIQEKKYFNLMEKVDVNGPETNEIFQFLKYNSELYDETKGVVSPIKWNFGKFLLDKEGRVIKYYAPTDDNMDADVKAAIDGKLVGSDSRSPSA
jgi:glutathione peroxidase-family protein